MALFTSSHNLHHAYLLKQDRRVLTNVLEELSQIGLGGEGHPDFFLTSSETFTIDDAREIQKFQSERAVSLPTKTILIATDYFSHAAQHALLKVLEEPKEGVHFFIVTNNTSVLLPTLLSRLITLEAGESESADKVEARAKAFLKGDKDERLKIVQSIVKEFEREETSIPLKTYSAAFLDMLEYKAGGMSERSHFNFPLLWKVKDYLHDQGSSVKNLLETLALTF